MERKELVLCSPNQSMTTCKDLGTIFGYHYRI
jgi:hypothetical protein